MVFHFPAKIYKKETRYGGYCFTRSRVKYIYSCDRPFCLLMQPSRKLMDCLIFVFTLKITYCVWYSKKIVEIINNEYTLLRVTIILLIQGKTAEFEGLSQSFNSKQQLTFKQCHPSYYNLSVGKLSYKQTKTEKNTIVKLIN